MAMISSRTLSQLTATLSLQFKERAMKTYVMEIVTQVLTVSANSEEEAEEKYSAHFDGEDCPCGEEDCNCVEDHEDCYHNTTEYEKSE
jgi:hypothetical protein